MLGLDVLYLVLVYRYIWLLLGGVVLEGLFFYRFEIDSCKFFNDLVL